MNELYVMFNPDRLVVIDYSARAVCERVHHQSQKKVQINGAKWAIQVLFSQQGGPKDRT